MKKIFFHIDLDAFFASVEQMDNPALQGKPVVVGALPGNRGVVSTCSYEARKYSIHSAQPISQAYKRCPHAIFVPPRGKRYLQVSVEIMSILHTFTPLMKQISIDEAFLDMSGLEKLMGNPIDMAKKVKQSIANVFNLTASIGIAENMFIAKLASDNCKPDGIYQVINKQGFLKSLPIEKIWGIGKKTADMLKKRGIQFVADLYAYSPEMMIQVFGKNGNNLYKLIRGEDNREISTGKELPKSISHEVTFNQDQNDPEIIESTFLTLAEKVSHRVRKLDLFFKTISIKVRDENFQTYTRSITTTLFRADTQFLFESGLLLFKKAQFQKLKIRLIGIGCSQFSLKPDNQDLFSYDKNEKHLQIEKAIDTIKSKIGKKAVKYAKLLKYDFY